MNCPAKNDDDVGKHPTWNQNPSFLPPELTTCQDLNGLVNAREHRNASEIAGSWFNSRNETLVGDVSPPGPDVATGNSEERPHWFSSMKAAAGNIQPRLPSANHTQPFSRFWDSVVWFASVLVCSYFLSYFSNRHGPIASPVSAEYPAENKTPATSGSSIRERSTCATGGIVTEDYNTPLHIGALFIILFVSGTACSFPLLASKIPKLRIPVRFFFFVRHFGTGVLIATAFVHLLPTAFILLGNPCLSDFWVSDYPAIPGAIALAGVFFVTIIEMVFHPSRRIDLMRVTAARGVSDRADEPSDNLNSLSNTADQIQPVEIKGNNDAERDEADLSKESLHNLSFTLTPDQKVRKDILQCILLEIGILFHSVFIGMTLSASVGKEFIILLIAIAFHQTFEGLALGSRIANIAWPEKTLQPWLMALAYGCTTPIGQAIGIGVSSLYTPDSEVGLILVGTMNAISSGLLVFASLVELLSEDFLSYESWQVLRGLQRVWAFSFVFFGAFCMSLVGAWA
ncbi:hypothetical protein ABW19_dt0209013 [Dactylella cylindrospora]|nr:hypothetical protein ABW19_dt0209013 [Dactylella cylindrospora]